MSWKPISHRGRVDGERNGVPGNTMRAFELLLEQIADPEVETDVRLTKSGVLFVGHDNLLQASTNGKGFANCVSRAELANLRVKCAGQVTEYGVPELEDVLKLFNGRGVIHLELKYGPDDLAGLVDAVLEQSLGDVPGSQDRTHAGKFCRSGPVSCRRTSTCRQSQGRA